MRTGFPGGPRLEWYDRNPIGRVNEYYGQDVGPHGSTARWTYTVPTGKKAFVELLVSQVLRSQAATAVGHVTGRLSGRGSGMLQAHIITNVVGDRDTQVVGQCSSLNAGEALAGVTMDTSTGGLMRYYLVGQATEFDA